GKTRIAPESQSAGMLYVEGGSLTTSSGFLVCEGAMSTGIVHVASGGAITNFDGWTSIGLNNGGYDALLQIDGGEMVTYGSGTSLGAQMGNGSRARIVVNDGMYKTDADVYLGEGSTLNAGNPSGSAEIEMNGGLFDNSAGKTYIGKHENLNSEGYVAALTLKGGEYITGGIECGTGVFSGRIDFNGGTLRAAGPGMFIESNGYLTVTTGTGNGTINDGGYDIEVATDISGAGKLYKAGSGTVTFSGSVTADGGVVVREGTVAVGAGGGITHGITLADSGYLLFDTATNGDTITPPVDITLGGGQVIIVATNKTYAVGNEIILENVTVADGYTLANSIQVRTGLMLDWTPSLSGTTVTLTAYQGSSVNYWVGGTSNMWHNALSWRYGIPTTNQTVAVTNDAIIIYDQTRNTDSNRSKDLCAGTFRIDANVTIKYSGSYINQLFVTDAYEGQGKITLIGSGIRAVNEITIPSTIGIATMNDGTTEIESWIDGEKPVTVEGPFELESSFRNYGHLIIAGKIAGTGTLCSQGTLRVTNNMQDFTGIVEITYEPTYFYGNCTGASNALWKVSNNFYLCDTNQMSAPYEFHFGAIQADTLKRFYMTAATENLYVGEKDDVESYIKGGAHFGTRAWDASDLLTGVTIVKRGGSKFTYSGYGCPNIEVESGELALENFTGTRYDNTTYAFIDSLTVKAGAILSGTYGDNLKNVTFEEGATYRQYLKSGTDGFAYDTLRASDKVTFKDGSVVELKDSTGYLTSVSVANAQTFTLLSAGSFGEGAPDGTGIKTAEGGPCCWMPAKSNNKLIYRAVNTRPGFIIRVR
ncbi:MAG: hypothetical protein J6W80_01425, partial [Kiritimatiellae bacterium]|nr:hypothetical protein [Kiritimatiellia bacterium]